MRLHAAINGRKQGAGCRIALCKHEACEITDR